MTGSTRWFLTATTRIISTGPIEVSLFDIALKPRDRRSCTVRMRAADENMVQRNASVAVDFMFDSAQPLLVRCDQIERYERDASVAVVEDQASNMQFIVNVLRKPVFSMTGQRYAQPRGNDHGGRTGKKLLVSQRALPLEVHRVWRADGIQECSAARTQFARLL